MVSFITAKQSGINLIETAVEIDFLGDSDSNEITSFVDVPLDLPTSGAAGAESLAEKHAGHSRKFFIVFHDVNLQWFVVWFSKLSFLFKTFEYQIRNYAKIPRYSLHAFSPFKIWLIDESNTGNFALNLILPSYVKLSKCLRIIDLISKYFGITAVHLSSLADSVIGMSRRISTTSPINAFF